MKWNFVKIQSWHVENHHNYHRLHSEWFHYSYHNIIVDDEKIYIISNFKNEFFWERKWLFVLSMWKLTLGYIVIQHICRNKNGRQPFSRAANKTTISLWMFIFLLFWMKAIWDEGEYGKVIWHKKNRSGQLSTP